MARKGARGAEVTTSNDGDVLKAPIKSVEDRELRSPDPTREMSYPNETLKYSYSLLPLRSDDGRSVDSPLDRLCCQRNISVGNT